MEIDKELAIMELRSFQADIRELDEKVGKLTIQIQDLLTKERAPSGRMGRITYDRKNHWIMSYGTPEEKEMVRNKIDNEEDKLTRSARQKIERLEIQRSQLALKILGVERVDIHGEYDETADVVDYIISWMENYDIRSQQ